MADAVADFRAEVDSSRSARDGFESVRVLANGAQLVFVTEDAKRTLALSDVFDVSQGISKRTDTSGEQSITVAFRDGEVREAVTLRTDGDTLATFQIALFSLLFDGTDVRMRLDGEHSGFDRATLDVARSAVTLTTDDGDVTIAHEDVAGFETTRKTFSGDEPKPVTVIYWADAEYDGKTTVVLPSFRALNLFGRYMQSYTAPSGTAVEEGWVRVLLVDDDPHDLEMTELMLEKEEPDVSVEAVTGAAAGLDRLADEDPVHCVVCDYDMPGTDGIEFLQQVRERRPNLPFILFTGQGSEAVAKRALLSDVTDYVEKGIGDKQYEILADRLRKALA